MFQEMKIPTQVQACTVSESMGLTGFVKETWESLHLPGLCQQIGTCGSLLGLPTKHSKPEGLKQLTFSLSQFWRLESEIKVLSGSCSLQSLWGDVLSCLFQLLVAPGIPQLVQCYSIISLSLASNDIFFLCVSFSASHKDNLIGLRAYRNSIGPHLYPQLNHICKDPIFNQGHVLKS